MTKILLTGDSIIARPFFVGQSDTPLKNLIKSTPFAFTNLEILPIDFKGHHAARSDGAHFAAPKSVLDDLLDVGFNLFSCANNHMLDYGETGLKQLIKNLEAADVRYSGLGETLGKASAPTYVDVDDTVVSLISCASTVFPETVAGERNDFTEGRYGVNPMRYDLEYHLDEESFVNMSSLFVSLGLDQMMRKSQDLGFVSRGLESNEDVLYFNDFNHRVQNGINAKFVNSGVNEIRTFVNKKDMERQIKWIEEAKRRSDICVVSLHAHESKYERQFPADFIGEFAKRAINRGADIVVCHGPHLLRGIEMHNGRPIFYSLGNFIGMNDLVEVLPKGSYERFGIDSSLLPSEVFDLRSEGGTKGFPGLDDFWMTVVPVVRFDDGGARGDGTRVSGVRGDGNGDSRIEVDRDSGIDEGGVANRDDASVKEIILYPVRLDNSGVTHRGKPSLVTGNDARHIIEHLSGLSESFGTEIVMRGDVGVVKL